MSPEDALREAIVSGRLLPNQRLVEADLTRTLGVGRSAVRAALAHHEERVARRERGVARVIGQVCQQRVDVHLGLDTSRARHDQLTQRPNHGRPVVVKNLHRSPPGRCDRAQGHPRGSLKRAHGRWVAHRRRLR